MNQEIEQKRIKVLPVLLEPCDLPGFLKGKLYADFTNPCTYTEGLAQILNRLELIRPTPQRLFGPALFHEALKQLESVRAGWSAEDAYITLSCREPYEAGEWLLEKLTTSPRSGSWMDRLSTIKIIARIINEMKELSFETADWLLERLTPTDIGFWHGWRRVVPKGATWLDHGSNGPHVRSCNGDT